MEFSDFFVQEPFNSTNVVYIQRQITELINRPSFTVCLIGNTTHMRPWVDWELQKTEELGKGIVGVKLHSAFQDFPPSIFNFDYEIVD